MKQLVIAAALVVVSSGAMAQMSYQDASRLVDRATALSDQLNMQRGYSAYEGAVGIKRDLNAAGALADEAQRLRWQAESARDDAVRNRRW